MQPRKALLAGVLGGSAMTLTLGVARGLGLPFNLEMILGSWVTRQAGALTWLTGFLIHLGISGLLGLLYALAFERVTHSAGARPGVLLSLVHTFFAGLAVGWIPVLHPVMPEPVGLPGAWAAVFGAVGVLVFCGAHLLYGAVVGLVYEPIRYEHRRVVHA